MLCDKCNNIHFKRLEDCDLIQQEPDRLDGDNDILNYSDFVFYIHHKNRHALKRSTDQGCHFCGMIWGILFGLRTYPIAHSKYHFARGEVILRRDVLEGWINDKSGLGLEDWNKLDFIYIQCEDQSTRTTSAHDFPDPLSTMLQALTLCKDKSPLGLSAKESPNMSTFVEDSELGRIQKEESIPAQHSDMYSPWLDVSTTSQASLVLASLWLKNCEDYHLPCKVAQKDSTLPRRIINISSPQQPFLEDGNGRKVPYVALSYMWGQSNRFVTTEKNESIHKKQIPLEELPKTFKEAIHVACYLGYAYLWIDALCILQDSPKDQEENICLMEDIFRSSSLTLYAAAGDHADAGLSIQRDPRWLKPCRLSLSATLKGKTVIGQTYITLLCNDVVAEPLFTRGWVLQEQILPVRGLLFGTRELTWRCRCGHSSEGDPRYQRLAKTWQELASEDKGTSHFYHTGWDGFNLLRMWLQEKDPMPDRPRQQRGNQFDHWYSLIEDYSERTLTYPSDVLRAIGGLASALCSTHNTPYMNGLWEDDIQNGLIWYVVSELDPLSRYKTPEASEKYDYEEGINAPSWSWISQWSKPIKFRGWNNHHRLFTNQGAKLRSREPNESSNSNSKTLKLTALVRVAVVDHTDQEINFSELKYAGWVSSVKDPESAKTIGQVAWDYDPAMMLIEKIHCLLCTVRGKNGEWQLTCLALVPTDETKEEFVRVGLVFIRQAHWFGSVFAGNPRTALEFFQLGKEQVHIPLVRDVCIVETGALHTQQRNARDALRLQLYNHLAIGDIRDITTIQILDTITRWTLSDLSCE